MEITNTNSAVQGVLQAQQSLNQNAAKISSKSLIEGNIDPIKPQAEMLQAEIQYTSSAKALKASDNMMGTFLDTIA